MKRDGNFYELAHTEHGIPTFRHTQTGELLHGQVGPLQEAEKLYIEGSGLLDCSGTAVIFDIGTGCAAQLIASRNAFLDNQKLKSLTIVSFDIEKLGLQALLENETHFPFIERHKEFLVKALGSDEVTETFGDRVLKWNFVGGDFVDTSRQLMSLGVKADFIFYDFFSPASHPHLWTFQLFRRLYDVSSENVRLLTYSSATAVRAALLAAGYFVGLAAPSGKKAHSTIACYTPEHLSSPLPHSWQNTFLKSHVPYSSAEPLSDQARIRERILSHPQFSISSEI